MKMMKTSLLACALALTGHVAHAQSATPCCDWGEVTVGASALLWKVGACDTQYAQSGRADFAAASFGTARHEYVGMDWDWGVEVFAKLDTGCTWIEGDYLWYETTGSSRVVRGDLGPPDLSDVGYLIVYGTPGSWAEAQASSRVRYQHATLSVGRPFYCSRCCHLDGLVLARYLDLDMRMRVAAADSTVIFPIPGGPNAPGFAGVYLGHPGSGGADAGFQGGGLGLGLQAKCDLTCGFHVRGGANFLCFFGKSQTAHTHFVIDPSMNEPPPPGPFPPFNPIPPPPQFEIVAQDLAATSPSRTCWVPGIDASIALAYSLECGCTRVTLELGWDTHYYFSALHETTTESQTELTGVAVGPIQGSSQLKTSEYESLAFGGPTFGVRAEF